MKRPSKELLKGCKNPKEIGTLLNHAQSVIKTWQPWWSPFLPAPIKEEALEIFSSLSDLILRTYGGYPNAERERIYFARTEEGALSMNESAETKGLIIHGNFLFDSASSKDFRQTLQKLGCHPEELGDIWKVGDRGAHTICTNQASLKLNGATEMLRAVQIKIESVETDQLQLPPQRLRKKFSTVEASKRLDAIASAGFGISRGKIINQLKQERLRINWVPAKQASKELKKGDRIQLEDRGSLTILNMEITKRGRWKIELLRE